MITRNDLQITSANGDLSRGGWIISGQTDGDTDSVSANLNLRLTGKSLADYIDSDWREAFNVHVIAPPDFTFDRYSSRAAWQAGTVDNFLKVKLQDISFASVASPSNSHEATAWNFGLVVTHILQHHCNAIYDPTGVAGSPSGRVTVTDIDITNSTGFELFIVRGSNNLWGSLQQIGGGESGGEFYNIWCDRLGVIHYQPHPAFFSPKPGAKGTLTRAHLRGQVRVTYNNSKPGEKTSQVQLACFAYRTTTYNSKYPASASGEGEVFELKQGVWAPTQGRANLLAERLYKWRARPYRVQVDVDPGLVLYGDDGRGLDLADRLLVDYSGPAEDALTGAGVHVDFDNASFFIHTIDIRFNQERRQAVATLTLESDPN